MSAVLKCAACTSQHWPSSAAGAVYVLDGERVNVLIDVRALKFYCRVFLNANSLFEAREPGLYDYRAVLFLFCLLLYLFIVMTEVVRKDASQRGCRSRKRSFFSPGFC